MGNIIRLSTVVLALAAMLSTSVAQAMEVRKFDEMAVEDQSDYITLLVEGAQKVLIDEGKSDPAAKIHKLFTEILPGDQIPLGMVEFERNLDRARLADAKRALPSKLKGRANPNSSQSDFTCSFSSEFCSASILSRNLSLQPGDDHNEEGNSWFRRTLVFVRLN